MVLNVDVLGTVVVYRVLGHGDATLIVLVLNLLPSDVLCEIDVLCTCSAMRAGGWWLGEHTSIFDGLLRASSAVKIVEQIILLPWLTKG